MNINRALKIVLLLTLLAAGIFAVALRLNKAGAKSWLSEHDDALEIPVEFR